MNRLFLLRHAKAAFASPGMRDFDRPLAETGERDARALGATMHEIEYAPEIVICSPARRARDTWACVVEGFGAGDAGSPQFAKELYDTDATGYLAIIRAAEPSAPLLIVGHNPIMEDLATALSSSGETAAMRTIAAGFPTCGLAVIDFDNPLSQIAPGTGVLHDFIVPRRL